MNNNKQSKVMQWVSKEHTYTNKKMILIIIGTMVLGSLLFGQKSNTPSTQKVVEKPVEKIVTKEVTPQSCKDVIELDNQIFIKISDVLSNMYDIQKMSEMTNFLNSNKDERTRNALDCNSK